MGCTMYKSLIMRRGKFFLFSKMCRPAMGPTKPPVHWIPGVLLLGVKWLRHEADHSAPSMAKAKNEWSYTSALHTSSWYAQGKLYHSYLISVCLHVQGQF